MQRNGIPQSFKLLDWHQFASSAALDAEERIDGVPVTCRRWGSEPNLPTRRAVDKFPVQ
jgi:hypothetical protein